PSFNRQIGFHVESRWHPRPSLRGLPWSKFKNARKFFGPPIHRGSLRNRTGHLLAAICGTPATLERIPPECRGALARKWCPNRQSWLDRFTGKGPGRGARFPAARCRSDLSLRHLVCVVI